MYDQTGHLLRKVGEGMFTQVFDVAIDSRKNIYAADPDQGRIVKFNASGDFITTWSVNMPTSLAIDISDRVYTVANNDHDLIVFDTTGNLLDSLMTPASQFCYLNTSQVHTSIWVGDYTSRDIKHYLPDFVLVGTLTITQGPSEPYGLRGVDDSGFCYVSGYQKPVYVFDSASTLKNWWSPGVYECLAILNRTVYVLSLQGLSWVVFSYRLPQ
jgi:DNA-binding beta-propeller fold protein YncE